MTAYAHRSPGVSLTDLRRGERLTLWTKRDGALRSVAVSVTGITDTRVRVQTIDPADLPRGRVSAGFEFLVPPSALSK